MSMLTLLQSVKLLMLRYIVTPPALRIDDDTATDDMDAICLRLAVLLDYLRSKPCTFTGMESSIQVLIAKFCLTSRTSDSGALLSHCRYSIGSSLMPLAAPVIVLA
ncbi:hypothetical protein TNCV_3150681 [Trichonephila clavipes]|nr:hypothetical protein TNCV_3150681 [Trichonephila clavipes]